MDNVAKGGSGCQQPILVPNGPGLTIRRMAAGVIPAQIVAGIRVGLLLLALLGCAAPDWPGGGDQTVDRQDIVVAHPTWPTEILEAVASGVICAGMTTDMVRAAWGSPSHVSSRRSVVHQRETWHYTGRQHNAIVIGGDPGRSPPLGEWTVAFVNGWVVGWTD